jgi:hypothetical protein
VKIIKVMGSELKLRLSPSFIQNAACPAYLKFRYVDKVSERWVRVEAERGKAAHDAIAALIEYCMAQEIEVADLEDEMLREALQKHLSHRILSEAGLVFEWLRLWRDRFKLPNNIHGVEEKIAIDEEYDECLWEDASYRGILDLNQITNEHCIITDWKSQPHIVPESELDKPIGSDIAEQMTHYAWLAWKMYPYLKTFTVRIWYLRYGFYHETNRSIEDLILYEHALLVKERKIAEIDNWDPIPGKHCQYCDYIHMCPIALDLSPSNPEIITQEQAVLGAQRVTVMEALVKDIKGKLKLYVNNNDNIVIGDNWIYGYNHKVSTSWDAADAEEVLTDHHRKLADVANVDVKKMKKLIKEAARTDPQLEGALEDIAKPKHKTEFQGYRKGDTEEVD